MAVIMTQQKSAALQFVCFCLTETLKMTAGHGFAFWISNLKVSCFICCVGSRIQVFFSGKKAKTMFEESMSLQTSTGRVQEDSHA